MTISNFSANNIANSTHSKQVKSVTQQVKNAETWAIALVKYLKEKTYVTPDELEEWMKKQKLPPILPVVVAAFLTGYVSAETYNSKFDEDVFGELAMNDSKDVITLATLKALLSVLDKVASLQPAVLEIQQTPSSKKKAEGKKKTS